MSEILLNEVTHKEDQSKRTVRLVQRDQVPNQMYEVIAFMDDYHTRIVRVSDNTRPKSFNLSVDEMDALCAAWLAFQADKESAKAKEIIRLSDVKAKAYRIADGCDAMDIETTDNHWTVHCPPTHTHAMTFSLDELLEVTKITYDHYIEHLDLVQQAKELLTQHHQIKVYEKTGQMGGKFWHIHILGTDHHWSEIHQASNLVESIESAISWLENNPDFHLSKEVCTILKKCPAIKVTQGLRSASGWYVTIPQLYTKNATSEELLQAVTEARDTYEQDNHVEQPKEPATAAE